jgi:MFS family permease
MGVLADRHGARHVVALVAVAMAVAGVLIAFGPWPLVVAGCAVFGVAMTGWMLPLSVLRDQTDPARIAWRTGLYRVCVDGGLFLGPFAGGLLGASHVGVLPVVMGAVLIAVAVLLRRS